MRLGFLTNVLVAAGVTRFRDVADWAVTNGFDALEVGPTVPLEPDEFRAVLREQPVRVTALTYCRNFLSTDRDEAAAHLRELERRIRLAGELGIEKIVTSTGIDKAIEEGVYDRADAIRKIPSRSLDAFAEAFTPLVRVAAECGVKLAFENCPLMGNIAISPVMWREIFRIFPDDHVGLTYDPSHLVWQFIDPYGHIAEFAPRIFHVHAKDTEIDRDQLAAGGFLTDFRWWKYRIVGDGELDWPRLLGELVSNGYDGTISVEHEDPDYEGSLDLVTRGLVRSRENLVAALQEVGAAA
jgi:sugar phosphate isomerase/epimerase